MIKSKRPLSPAWLAAWTSVVTAYQTCVRRYAEMLVHFELTIPQFDVLVAIQALEPEAMPSAVADRLLVTRGNVTGILQRLESQGRVYRVPHAQDGRAWVFALTEEGRALLGQATCAAKAFMEAQLDPFDDEIVDRVGTTMNEMTHHLLDLDIASIIAQPSPNGERHK